MLDTLRAWSGRLNGTGETTGDAPEAQLKPLRLLTAELLLLTGVGTTVELMARARRAPVDPRPASAWELEREMEAARTRPSTWAPALVAPLAALAHLVHGARPSASTGTATRVLDAASIGVALVGLADALAAPGGGRGAPPLSPMALASAGALGLLLNREARHLARERDRLERRAAVVERLVPRRRAKLDRIVVHV